MCGRRVGKTVQRNDKWGNEIEIKRKAKSRLTRRGDLTIIVECCNNNVNVNKVL